MAMSSEERRRRVRKAVEARRKNNPSGQRTGQAAYSGTDSTGSRDRANGADRISRVSQTNRSSQRRRRQRKKRNQAIIRLVLLVILAAVILVVAVLGIRAAVGWLKNSLPGEQQETTAAVSGESQEETTAEPTVSALETTLAEAELMAAMYDYDGAIALLSETAETADSPEAQAAIAEYEQIKTTLVKQDISQITHVFFHILTVDSENAFDVSKWGKQAEGYNSLMTTIPEFERMLDIFYEEGYVLVGLHDMAEMETQPDGTVKMVEKDIMLPPGKKAMVMSEDDVCYYEYMEGAGFADRMIVGEDGRPTCVYVDENGTEHVGAYDLVPILDQFIDEHPDFSYQGAKAIIAFTGYNGILGYRTDETYDPSSDMYDPEKTANPNIEADRETARQVVEALRQDGYELASHSWGHRDMGAISLEHLKMDTDRWDRNVNQELLGGTCDIIIYPKGADVGDWRESSYSHETNAKFDYLWNKGFRYFCNVDASTPAWVQKGSDFLRQGRRPLDGYNLWNDIANGKNRLSDLFTDVSAVFDSSRPTPVLPY